jgi:hypothetical protein
VLFGSGGHGALMSGLLLGDGARHSGSHGFSDRVSLGVVATFRIRLDCE